MSDWRQDDGPAKKPQAPRQKNEVPQLNPLPTGGWKGRASNKKTQSAPADSSRSWTGGVALDESQSASALSRWLIVGLLSVSAVTLIVALVIFLAMRNPKLPMVGFIVGRYDSEELLENPYGNTQRDLLANANKKGIEFVTREQNGNDDGLGDVVSPDWTKVFVQLDKRLLPGGPDHKFVAFYVSAYATFENDLLYIHPQNSKPFQAPKKIALSTLLENLGLAVDKKGVAWVVLDLQLPTVLSNLGDLDPPWRTATEAAIKAVPDSCRDRLIVTIPGDDGQQNWLAPEYGTSFLGHHLRQLLSGSDTQITVTNNAVTLGNVQKMLAERVRKDVATRRYAVQQPLWIPTATVDKYASYDLLTMPSEKPASAQTKVDVSAVKTYTAKIDAFWKRLSDEAYRAYRWDPLGYAAIESQLLMLEEVAIYRADQYLRVANRVEAAFKEQELKRPQFERKVSLIEDQLRVEYFTNPDSPASPNAPPNPLVLAQSIAKQLPDRLPVFWLPVPDEKAAAERQPQPEEQLTGTARAHFVWQLLVAVAESKDSDLRQQVFRDEWLRRAWEFVGSGNESSSWLEMLLLKRLVQDIDWSATNATPFERANACAEAVLVFDQLQRVAMQPDPEISWWLSDQKHSMAAALKNAETLYMRGFDQCLAGYYLPRDSFSGALSDFQQAADKLREPARQVATLQAALDRYYRATHDLPHLLAWALREYQYASEFESESELSPLKKVEERLKQLAELVALTEELHGLLAKPMDMQQQIDNVSERLSSTHKSLLDAFNRFVELEVIKGAPTNPLPFRCGRIVLLSPLLPLDAREQLHNNSFRFLEMGNEAISGGEERDNLRERSARNGAKIFLDFLPQSSSTYWQLLVKGEGDPRLEIAKLSAADEPLPSSETLLGLRSMLWEKEHGHRVLAASFGSFVSLQQDLINDATAKGMSEIVQWPWSLAWQRWNLSAANDVVYQVQRLANASWGDGDFGADSQPTDFYFHQLASKYELPVGFTNCQPIMLLADRINQRRLSILKNSAARVTSLEADFGRQQISLPRTRPISIQVVGQAVPDSIAQVMLQNRQGRLPWIVGQPFDSWVVNLGQEDRSIKREFDSSYWQSSPPSGVLLFRGNRRVAPIDWQVDNTQQEVLQLTLQGQSPKDAKLQVNSDEAPIVNVLFLVDCSGSMDTEVTDFEGERDRKQFDLVKDSVQLVISRFQEIHDAGEARIRTALIPFGLSYELLPAELKSLLIARAQDRRYYRTNKIAEMDIDWVDQIKRNLFELKLGGDTPLYNSIIEIVGGDQLDAKNQTILYVFTDGVNSPENSRSAREVIQAVKGKANLSLKIFHFNNFDRWIGPTVRAERKSREDQRKWSKIELDKWEREETAKLTKEFDDGVADLTVLLPEGLGNQFSYFESSDSGEVRDDALKSIKGTTVHVVSADAQGQSYDSKPRSVREWIGIGKEFLPATFEVRVERPSSTSVAARATIPVELYGGEELVLPINSRGELSLQPLNTSNMIRETDGRRSVHSPPSLNSRLFAQLYNGNERPTEDRGLQLFFMDEERSRLTKRPKFLVAEASPSNASERTQRYLLADYRWRSNQVYPNAVFSDFPWPDATQRLRLRVWAADGVPSRVTRTVVAPNETLPPIELGKGTLQVSHDGKQLSAKVSYRDPPQPSDRIVFVCPGFEYATRSYDQTNLSEGYGFQLSELQQQRGAEIQYSTVGELEQDVEAGNLTRFEFEQISVAP